MASLTAASLSFLPNLFGMGPSPLAMAPFMFYFACCRFPFPIIEHKEEGGKAAKWVTYMWWGKVVGSEKLKRISIDWGKESLFIHYILNIDVIIFLLPLELSI
jgi:hypothetical protein